MIKLITTSKELLLEVTNRPSDKSVGFVPTMGNLHLGHLSLVETSLKENDITFVSIFVNPKQFGKNEDFGLYPRTLDQDLELLKSLKNNQKTIVVFAPQTEIEIYPKGFSTQISVQADFSKILCAKSRPGHFGGVATVVYLLFQYIKPDRAYFGQKDLQQLHVIKKLTQDLMLPVQIISCPIVRDENGLALSSRNQYLSKQEKQKALVLSQGLKKLASFIQEKQDFDCADLEAYRDKITGKDSNWEYLEILDADQLGPLSTQSLNFALLGAYKLGKTRLIDNLIVRKP